MILARKMSEFYIIIARKKYYPEFGGGGARAPCPRLLRLRALTPCVSVINVGGKFAGRAIGGAHRTDIGFVLP